MPRTNRHSIHRRSLPIATFGPSLITVSERNQSVRVETGILNTDSEIYTLLDHQDTGEEPLERVAAANLQLQREDLKTRTPEGSLLQDDMKNKLDKVKMEIFQEKLLKENMPSYYNSPVTYQADKGQEIKEIILRGRRRRRSVTFSCEMDPHRDIANAAEIPFSLKKHKPKTVNRHASFKLPNIFEKDANCNSGINLSTTTDNQLLSSKVKEFLQKPQPKASVSSLRIQKHPDTQLTTDRREHGNQTSNTGVPGKLTGIPINTDTCPQMSHFKDRKWYYQDKSGKCRYLRVPESPIPPVSYVFSDDIDV